MTRRLGPDSRRPFGLAAATLVAAAAPLLAAQQQEPQQRQPVFRAGVDVIQVDVSVLDENRRPIRGLTADDFVVLENGVPQTIVGFVPVDVPDPEPVATEWLRDVVPDVRSNDLGDGRLFAIIMDDATLPPDPFLLVQARAIGREVIDQMGPDDLASVIFTGDNRHSVDFTTDRGRLRNAVNRLTPGFVYDINHGNSDTLYYSLAIQTLRRVTAYLSTVPQRRKAIVYVSTGVPVDMEEVAQPVAIGEDAGGMGERDLAEDLVSEVQQAFGGTEQSTFLQAQHGNVNIYSIDPSGVGGLSFFLERQQVLGQHRGLVESVDQTKLHQDFLRMISAISGGRAVVNTNDFRDGVRQVFRENSAYYLIGYESTRARDDETVRSVEVQVNRRDADVRTRSAYFDQRSLAAPDVEIITTELKLQNALADILPNPEIVMRAAVSAFPTPDGREAALAIVIGMERLASADAVEPVQETLELLISAFTSDGGQQGTMRRTLRVPITTGPDGFIRYDLLSRLDLPPGRYQLRMAAHSVAQDKSGSVFYEVEVPDFADASLALSGVVLEASPGLIAGPQNTFLGLLPIVPTSQRDFLPTDAVKVFFQVTQESGRTPRPVNVEVRVTDETNTVRHRVTEQIAADRFSGDSAAEYGLELPLDQFRPGRYLLTVEASRGGTGARRDVPFVVR